ncbi:BTAD domain-containing putative transcriptional regulator [Nocardia sp. NPDC051832]|uniref:BTAD domain-containing putative transcriptional regulator n=1 Tax=Nocardia sp. NPDC051832 TaxID=3155673 RepID=UPI00342F845B
MLVARVLGPLEITCDGRPLDIGGPLPRRLLAALILAAGRPVPVDRLADLVWHDTVPRRPAQALQVYVSRLRTALAGAGRDLIERDHGGYALRLAPQSVDAIRFTGDVEQASALLSDDQPARAAAVLSEALGLWRGEPYSDLAEADLVLAERARLTEVREVAIETRLDAVLSTGAAPAAIGELEAAARQAPHREHRWALLALGLYRSDRQADALDALRRARRLLAEDLGVDPGPELQRVEHMILAQDPHLLLPPNTIRGDRSMCRPARPGRGIAVPLSSFVGRDDELRELDRLLSVGRLVTLVGAAGVGKTRLALEYASARRDSAGPWLVRLADVQDLGTLEQAIADAVGAVQVAAALPALRDVLAAGPGLLVVDNCEHLVEAVASTLLDLLTSCPGLRVLATSREPLSIDGEIVLPVDPLAVHAPDGTDGPAVALLLDRVHAIRPGWSPGTRDRDDARHLCRTLDGIPLALELAAARARLLGLGAILELLDRDLIVPGAAPVGSPTPHATLQAAIAWSIDRLRPGDRALLLRLWSFEGGFTLDAAEAVRPHEDSALQALSSLVTKSVVSADTTAEPTRYRLLETIRSYCRQIDPSPERSREAHAAWARGLIAESATQLWGPRAGHASRVLSRELPNVRAAIAYDLRHRPEHALRSAALLEWFWVRSGHSDEGLRVLDLTLAAAPDAALPDRVRAEVAKVLSIYYTRGAAAACRQLDRAEQMLGQATDEPSRLQYGKCQYYAAMVHLSTGAADPAYRCAQVAATIGADLGNNRLIVLGRMTLNAALIQQGHIDAGEKGLLDAIRLAEQLGQYWEAGWGELTMGQSYLHRAASDNDAADHGRSALAALQRALTWYLREDDVLCVLAAVDHIAHALAFTGQFADAVRLHAAYRKNSQHLGPQPELLRRPGQPRFDDITATALTPQARNDAETSGWKLTWQQMLEVCRRCSR